MPRIKLIDNAAVTGAEITIPSGRYCFAVDGTFTGATVTLTMLSPDGTNFISVGADAALTAEGAVEVALPSTTVKATVSGGTPANLYATLDKID
jgi:hypothetical protein